MENTLYASHEMSKLSLLFSKSSRLYKHIYSHFKRTNIWLTRNSHSWSILDVNNILSGSNLLFSSGEKNRHWPSCSVPGTLLNALWVLSIPIFQGPCKAGILIPIEQILKPECQGWTKVTVHERLGVDSGWWSKPTPTLVQVQHTALRVTTRQGINKKKQTLARSFERSSS